MTHRFYTFLTFLLLIFGLAISENGLAQDYFTLTNTGTANATIYLRRQSGNYSNTINMAYSINSDAWTDATVYGDASHTNLQVTVPAGQNIRFRGNNLRSNGTYSLTTSKSTYWYIYSTQSKFTASGDIMSLVAYDEGNSTIIADAQMGDYCFYCLFGGTNGKFTSMTDASQLKLPAKLSSYCFSNMFYGCSSLVTPPALPATTLQSYCYYQMFQSCIALTTAPALPTVNLNTYCYAYMFSGCKQLTTAPTLAATEMQEACYQYMFQNCSALVNVQDTLPGLCMPKFCYQGMFKSCVALTEAPEIMATSDCGPGQACCNEMFSECSNLVKAPSILRPEKISANMCYYHMFSSCPKLTTAPTICVNTLGGSTNALWYMFYNDSQMKKIRVYFKSWKNGNGTGFTNSWVYNVADQGAFYCPPELPRQWQSSYNGYYTPKNTTCKWTVFSYNLTYIPVGGTWPEGGTTPKQYTWQTDTSDVQGFMRDLKESKILIGYFHDPDCTQPFTEEEIIAFLATQQETSSDITKNIYVKLGTAAPAVITFIDHDGTQLAQIEVAQGVLPVYPNDPPKPYADDTKVYLFSGWTPKIVKATEDAIYTATYTTKERFEYLSYPLTEEDKQPDMECVEK